MHYIRRMLLLLLALTPLGVCAQTQQSTKTERRSAMTDSVYRLTEVVVRSNQMLGSKFEVRNRTGAAYYIRRNWESLVIPTSTVCSRACRE